MSFESELLVDRRALLGLGAAALTASGLLGCASKAADDASSGASGSEESATPVQAASGDAEGKVVGIIGAMESEVTAIKAAMQDAKTKTISQIEVTEGTIDGTKVVLAQCGVGKVNAAMCAQTLIVLFGATCIINTGVAGSLSGDLSINDFVISTDAVQHDYDTSPIGFQKGEILYTGMVAFPADEQLRAKAVEAVKRAAPESKVLEGRVCSGDQFIATEEQKQVITSEFGGLCAEMEGAAIAQVCYLNDTPFVIIRAISDGGDGMDFATFQEEAAKECAAATIAMVHDIE